MATTVTFSDMLNQYLPNKLLKEEFVKRDYILSNIEQDNSWLGGDLIVPFRGAHASSVKAGGLTDTTDVAEEVYVRGSVTDYKEIWGTMVFNSTDLKQHGKVSEQNFLKLLPDTIEDFLDYMKNVASTNLMIGAHFAKLLAGTVGTVGGVITVDRPDRFVIKQKVFVDDDDSAVSAAGYVQAINMNTKEITVHTTRAGGVALDLSAYSAAQNGKVYNDGFQTAGNPFSSLRDALLSAANGGSSTLYGQTKTAYPYLQAINIDGSGVTATNIMEQIFDALTTIRQFGKGRPTDVVMSYKNWGSVLKVIELSKGAFNVTPGSQKASQFGWEEISVGSVTKGSLKLIAVQEADDDIIMFLDWRALKFYSNGMFRRERTPDGNEFYTERTTSGYKYYVDIALFGELVVLRPSYCGILYSISY